MKFELYGKTIILRGLKNTENKVINGQELQHATRKKKGIFLQLLPITECDDT